VTCSRAEPTHADGCPYAALIAEAQQRRDCDVDEPDDW
jgi:hypothetical protein